MSSRREWVRLLWREQPGLHRGYVVDVATAAVMAAVLILGGRQRTVAPVWDTLNVSGGPVAWGFVFAAMAVLLIVATFVSSWAMVAALWVGATLYALIGWWFLQSAWDVPSASFIGVVYSFRAAATHVFRGEAYRVGTGAAT